MSPDEAKLYAEIVKGLSRKEIVQMLAGVQNWPTEVLTAMQDALKEQLARHNYGAWY